MNSFSNSSLKCFSFENKAVVFVEALGEESWAARVSISCFRPSIFQALTPCQGVIVCTPHKREWNDHYCSTSSSQQYWHNTNQNHQVAKWKVITTRGVMTPLVASVYATKKLQLFCEPEIHDLNNKIWWGITRSKNLTAYMNWYYRSKKNRLGLELQLSGLSVLFYSLTE